MSRPEEIQQKAMTGSQENTAIRTTAGNVPATFFQRFVFRLRIRIAFRALLRKWGWQILGAQIGKGTGVPRIKMNWPHQVRIGCNCVLEEGSVFNFARMDQSGPSILIGDNVFIGYYCEFNISESIVIGNDALIASGCKFIDHNHGIESGTPIHQQPNTGEKIVIEEDVWLGSNVIVLQGVTIGRGAVIGAGAVVTRSVPAGEIWAGIPARKVRERG
jgi:acetyltransferase-like isoleucine patch superfamily enzyme